MHLVSRTDNEPPEEAENIIFFGNYKNIPDFGIINLCSFEENIQHINDLNHKVSDLKELKFYFPLFEHYVVKKYTSKTGFTLKLILDKINRIAKIANSLFKNCDDEDYYWVGEYAITCHPNDSDVKIYENNIYIDLQH